MRRLRVLLLFGGQSGEHEVSIVSATHVKQALDLSRYDVEMVGITKAGVWVQLPSDRSPADLDDPSQRFNRVEPLSFEELSTSIDVVFPLLHGPHGEDGTVQGVLELTGVPYVGCGVLASAVAMDKVMAKRVFRDAGIPVVPGQLVLSSQLTNIEQPAVLDRLERELRYPMFVQPANLGSSIGVSKVFDRPALTTALAVAAQYDRRLLVETAVPHAREIEVAVLGNDTVRVSVPGEIVPDHEFFDYDSKYAIDSASQSVIPAKLDAAVLELIQQYAEQAFRAIDGAGLSRVDFLLNGATDEVFLNEINTMPGFRPIGMFAKLWEATGTSYNQMIDEIIELARDRSAVTQSLRMTR